MDVPRNPGPGPLPPVGRLALVALAFAVGLGCGAKKGVEAPVARHRMAVPACTGELSKDPLEVTVLAREGTALVLRLGWLGGCTQHRFDACWYLAGKDDLVVVVGHDAHGDACTSFLERPVELDLSSIPAEVTQGRAPTMLVRLETPRRR